MHKINVLIIEDNKSESDALVAVLEANQYNIVGVATTYAMALQLFYSQSIDIFIVDVFLNGQPEGINFAETISLMPETTKPFVFLTSSNDRQVFERAKLTKPFSFLMKPFNKLEILYAIELSIEKFNNQANVFLSEDQNTVVSNDFLFVKKKNSLKKILISDILFIEVEDRYCNVVTDNDKFLIQISLTKIIEFLDSKKFCRVHRNSIVNTDQIVEIMLADNLVILKGNRKLNIGENYKNFVNLFQILK